jgi:hypothetical protein
LLGLHSITNSSDPTTPIHLSQVTMALPFAAPPPPESPLFRHRQLAPTANVRVSPICLGAMNFGDAHKVRLICYISTIFESLRAISKAVRQ